jgi:hypothetical protein
VIQKGRATKSARWFTGAGSVLLFAAAILHSTRYFPLVKRIEAKAVPYPLDGILKSTWVTFSVQLMVLTVIAFVASRSERGGWIVLLCAASTGLTCLILLRFLGPFIGVYLTVVVVLLLVIGGWLQLKQKQTA